MGEKIGKAGYVTTRDGVRLHYVEAGLRSLEPFAPVCATSAVCTSLRCCGLARAAGRAACVAAAGLAATGARPALAGAAGGSAVWGDASAWGHVQRGFIFPILRSFAEKGHIPLRSTSPCSWWRSDNNLVVPYFPLLDEGRVPLPR